MLGTKVGFVASRLPYYPIRVSFRNTVKHSYIRYNKAITRNNIKHVQHF